mmetsp:Transcript_27367/g.61876  ORF Transcript_27367/g.61876 Transcript_27367/m.61876 type:complete len:151 (+) Transcript_27367:393-845(+)
MLQHHHHEALLCNNHAPQPRRPEIPGASRDGVVPLADDHPRREASERSHRLHEPSDRLEEAAASYKMNPGLHVCEECESYDRNDEKGIVQAESWTPKCQICNKGLCQHAADKGTVGKRCQKAATMCCTGCNVLVCGAFCWKKLHGYAKGA